MLLLLAAAATLVYPENWHSPEVTFSAHPALKRMKTEIRIGFLENKEGVTQYWISRSMMDDARQIARIKITDTLSCPAGREILSDLARLEGVRPFVSGLDGSDDIFATADGITYELEAKTAPPFQGGNVKITTNTRTPLARWVEASFSKLSGCWSD